MTDFQKWLFAVDLIAKSNNVPGESYTDATGTDAWIETYIQGNTPEEAWNEEIASMDGTS